MKRGAAPKAQFLLFCSGVDVLPQAVHKVFKISALPALPNGATVTRVKDSLGVLHSGGRALTCQDFALGVSSAKDIYIYICRYIYNNHPNPIHLNSGVKYISAMLYSAPVK